MSAAPERVFPAPPASELTFPRVRALRARDVFALAARAWPFIRPYRRHLLFLFLLMLLTFPVGLNNGLAVTSLRSHILFQQEGAVFGDHRG